MRKIIFFHKTILFTFILVCLNCYADTKFPLTSGSITNYYAKASNPSIFEFYLSPQLQTKNFTEEESKIPIKAEYFSFNTVNTNIRHFEVGSFQIGSFHYKLVIYNRFGEGDSQYFNAQLNSYDSSGRPIDALLVDSRFGFEETNSFRYFSINANGEINITYNIIKLYDMDKDENHHEIKNPKSNILAKEIFQIKDGVFKLIRHEGEDLK